MKVSSPRSIDTCFSPALYEQELHAGSIVIVIDILRASSAICTAFANGASAIIPVSDVGEAKEYKSKGYLVAAERDGFVLDFADFGNSPFNFTREKVSGRTIVYSTTNGTGIINLSASAYMIAVGCFLNMEALLGWTVAQDKNVMLFCAGWKNRFNLEDTIFAGALADRLMQTGKYSTICDSTLAAIDLWSIARTDLRRYIEKAAQRTRLKDKKLDDCIDFCLTSGYTNSIPVMRDGVLVSLT
jgi:2-phosphosulfolactate phosphatase